MNKIQNFAIMPLLLKVLTVLLSKLQLKLNIIKFEILVIMNLGMTTLFTTHSPWICHLKIYMVFHLVEKLNNS